LRGVRRQVLAADGQEHAAMDAVLLVHAAGVAELLRAEEVEQHIVRLHLPQAPVVAVEPFAHGTKLEEPDQLIRERTPFHFSLRSFPISPISRSTSWVEVPS